MRLVVKIVCEGNGIFRAWCPCLPGCTVRAISSTEAQEKIEAAIRSYMMSLNAVLPTELRSHLQMCAG